jgi:hypothetical protein
MAAYNDRIDHLFGLPSGRVDTVGAWASGAEHSLMISAPSADPLLERVAIAMKGWLAKQRSVLLFRPDDTGENFVASFPAAGDLRTIHQNLLDDGAAFHTLQPIQDGAVVYIYGQHTDEMETARLAAARYDTALKFTMGKGEFIGTKLEDPVPDATQRADARREYERILEEARGVRLSGGRDLAASWEDLKRDWDTQAAEAERLDRGRNGQP